MIFRLMAWISTVFRTMPGENCPGWFCRTTRRSFSCWENPLGGAGASKHDCRSSSPVPGRQLPAGTGGGGSRNRLSPACFCRQFSGRSVPSPWRTLPIKRPIRFSKILGNSMQVIDMDRSGMNVKKLEASGAEIAYVMPSHQYPLGTVMPIKRRLELLKWADGSKERYIIEDDYDSEFRYKGKPIPALPGLRRTTERSFISEPFPSPSLRRSV